jgi:hypothetical protein
VPLIVMTARKMKRVLAEEQNGLFDAVRRHSNKRQPLTDVAVLLPPVAEHVALYRSAIDEPLRAAALAGASSLSTEDASALQRAVNDAAVLAPVDTAIEQDVVMPLRERLERCLHDVEGDADDFVGAARSVYREWKSEHIDEHVDDLVHLAYGRGAHAVLSPGTPVCWLVDPNGPDCPDAEDNALAGAWQRGSVPHRARAPTGPCRVPLPARPNLRVACRFVRIPSDLPPRQPRQPRQPSKRWISRGRIILAVVLGVFIVLFLSARSLSSFYVDYLWHDALGRTDVFWGILWAKVQLALVFTVGFALCSPSPP